MEKLYKKGADQEFLDEMFLEQAGKRIFDLYQVDFIEENTFRRYRTVYSISEEIKNEGHLIQRCIQHSKFKIFESLVREGMFNVHTINDKIIVELSVRITPSFKDQSEFWKK